MFERSLKKPSHKDPSSLSVQAHPHGQAHVEDFLLPGDVERIVTPHVHNNESLLQSPLTINYDGPREHENAWRRMCENYIRVDNEPVLQSVRTRTAACMNELVFGRGSIDSFIKHHGPTVKRFAALRRDLEDFTDKNLTFPVPSARWKLYRSVLHQLSLHWVGIMEQHRLTYGPLRSREMDAGYQKSALREARDGFRQHVWSAQLVYGILNVALIGLIRHKMAAGHRRAGLFGGTTDISDKSLDLFETVMFNFDPAFQKPFLNYVFIMVRPYALSAFNEQVKRARDTVLFGEIDNRQSRRDGDFTPFIDTVSGPAHYQPEVLGENSSRSRHLQSILDGAGLTEREKAIVLMIAGVPAPNHMRTAESSTQRDGRSRSSSSQALNEFMIAYGGDSMSLAEVGQAFGISRERVRQIQAVAFQKLQTFVKNRK